MACHALSVCLEFLVITDHMSDSDVNSFMSSPFVLIMLPSVSGTQLDRNGTHL